MTEIIGLDLGFGNVKGKNLFQEIMFPSVVGPSRNLIESTVQADTEPLNRIIDNKRSLFIGDLALRQSATKMFSLKENKAGHESTKPLLEVALGLLAKGRNVNVVTGLPVTFYFQQKEELSKVFKRDHDINIQVGGQWIERTISVDEVKLVPQPLGSAIDFLLDREGNIKEDMKKYAKGRIGVLDIGFYTNDLLVLDGLEVAQDYSRSLRSGMSVAYRAMNDAGIDVPIYDLEKMVRRGQYRSASEQAFQALAQQIQGEVETYWPQLDLIIITGGGGHELFRYLKLPGESRISLNPSLANVKGYYKLGRRAWGRGNNGQLSVKR
ncbi:ParM/StbA family protein [Sutcliffiella horikoshii]|uniref:ParM/StbA family protein n=1 Tax=Sutcliffiella horikoshii TaxID=79883 RepID=A0A5D4SN65_9BACI|nr:ParM/StbA family protein [Sutcliffiella horikoshii]TYS64479.1 ParM/StbA family protein [Sutcliffiella horikoshii]